MIGRGPFVPPFAIFSNLLAGAAYFGLEISKDWGAATANFEQWEGAAVAPTSVMNGSMASWTTSSNRRRGVVDKYFITAQNPVVTQPEAVLYGWGVSQAQGTGETWDTGGLGGPFAAGWNGLVPAGVGIGVDFNNVRTGIATIGELSIWQHPTLIDPS